MERDRLICCLVGKFSALEPNITAEDLRIKIDQHLQECNFTSIGTEDGDLELIQDLLDETMMSIMGAGINRKMRRGIKKIER